jgi:hypothetical protein
VSAFAGRPIPLDDRDLRTAAAALLGCAAARAALPGEPGLPCALRELTGVPCPLCGLTTSVTETVELDVGGAIAANPGGLVLVALGIAVLLGPGRRLVVSSGLVYFGLAAMWLWELNRFAVI